MVLKKKKIKNSKTEDIKPVENIEENTIMSSTEEPEAEDLKAIYGEDFEEPEQQNTFNEDGIDVLVEDGEVENLIIDGVMASSDKKEPEEIVFGSSSYSVRTSNPGAGNKCFITRGNGGWSWCIKGKPTDAECNVLANCVGYADGRFNEIYNLITKYTGMKYYTLCCNAENFIEKAKAAGLEVVDYPVLGGIMVMQKGATLSGKDGAGHVFIVEKILEFGADGYASKIYTSESSYNGSAFWNSTRTNANGRWGHASSYSFRGCIVNPAIGKEGSYKKPEPIPEPTPTPEPTPAPSEWPKTHIVKKGEVLSKIALKYYGNGDYNHYMFIARANNISNPNLIYENQKLTIPKYENTSTSLKVGDKVMIISSYASSSTSKSAQFSTAIGWERTIMNIYEGRNFPYAVGNNSGITGFCKAEGLKKL